jgi:hypothetical protein
VPVDETLNARLTSLARLLEQLPAPASPAGDPLAQRLASIADDRLRLLGARLAQRASAGEMDAEDALLLRLLLHDYTAGVAHLRALVAALDEQMREAENTIKAGRRAVRLTNAHAEPDTTGADT